MKRLITVVMALIMILGAAVVPASAAETDASSVGSGSPEIRYTQATANAVRIAWNKYSGAVKYRVFIKNGKSWKGIGNTDKLYYDHTSAVMYTPYTYTVRAMDKNGNFISDYDRLGWPGLRIRPASVTKVENIDGGVKLTIVPASMTYEESSRLGTRIYDTYRIFVKGGTYGSSWTRIATTAQHSTVSVPIDSRNSGEKLSFTVRAANGSGDYISYFNSGKTATYIAAPTLSIATVNGGHQLTVNRVKGASKYRVFVREVSGWKKIADTTSTCTYKSLTAGRPYTYTVRAINASGAYISGFSSVGFTMDYRKTPKLSKLEQSAGCLRLTWSSVSNTSYYRVFRKGPEDKSWKGIAYTASASYNDYDIEEGVKYTYTVRCADEYGRYTSYFDTIGLTGTYLGWTEIMYAENSGYGITLCWNTVDAAAKYRLFIKLDGTWTAVTDTNKYYTTYADVEEGETYTFAVRAVDKNGKYCTGMYSSGFLVTYHSNAETTLNENKLVDAYSSAVSSKNIVFTDKDLDKNKYAVRTFIADTGCYGDNCGDVTKNLSTMGKRRINAFIKELFPNGADYNKCRYKIQKEEYEHGTIYYLYIGVI